MPIVDPNSATLDVEIPVDTHPFQQSLIGQVVTRSVAQHVLWCRAGDQRLGLQPGSFVDRLLSAIAAADSSNRDLLAKAFPGYVAASRALQNEPWGLDWLRDVARGDIKTAAGE
jgi:hypothetical protein